ncbi:hypothetical protein BBK36DRAFT_1163806 [Trichoderma citrinoviride]|uniref:Uncharacterized protein n=1 Tax=Trichoderma citrinoviride TaxID=58853 RepID=A0A2T4AX11_9HYPO|nr:hypothetical protein BBK36DRAFT_1163806 [Trichoderma citrinoviride]PTB61614.1 hypothetical protein BBK36DRAFT_1163806 [Trichoderma citrinoviride]
MSNVPPAETREAIAAKLTSLIATIESDPAFDRSSPAASALPHSGYEFRLPGQIKISARGDAAAKQLYNDTLTRSLTLDQLISGPPMMRAMMGMAGPVSPEIQAASKAVVDAFKA